MEITKYAPPIIILITSLLILVGVLTSKASRKLGIPALVFFLLVGMLAGYDGPGRIYFDDYWTVQLFGSAALAFILFSGGMDTRWPVARTVLAPAITLGTLGVIITAGLLGWFMHAALGMSLLEGLLLGAIVSSTDAAAVFSILRSQNVQLKGSLEPLLEVESGGNDPMAVFLTLGLTQLLTQPETTLLSLSGLFFAQMGIGAVLGWFSGKFAVWLMNRIHLEIDGLYPPLSFAIVMIIFGVTTVVGGRGFLAVYVAGLIMGNSSFIHKKSLMRFHDGMAWLMQITMFLLLGLLVFPSQVVPVMGTGLAAAGFLIFAARPISVFLCLIPFRYTIREKLMISWVGLRGAVPIILATFPTLAGLTGASFIFNVVFFVVVSSALFQGTGLNQAARWLKLDQKEARKPSGFDDDLIERYAGRTSEIAVRPGSPAAGKRIVDLNLPPASLVALIRRDGDFIIPRGDVTLLAGDEVVIAADQESLNETRRILTGT